MKGSRKKKIYPKKTLEKGMFISKRLTTVSAYKLSKVS